MERYVIRGGWQGYERLRLLARERWPDTAVLFERAGLSPGMRCIDLGCGGGLVTLEIARLVAPGGSVTGVDMDEIKLDLARRAAAERGLANVEFRLLDVRDWDEPGGYDAVYCRSCLCGPRFSTLVETVSAGRVPDRVLVQVVTCCSPSRLAEVLHRTDAAGYAVSLDFHRRQPDQVPDC